MRRFLLLGDPVEHTLSPVLHGAAFAAWGVDAAYEARRVDAGTLRAAMREASGGNVTLPHKLRAAELLDDPRADVRATGACNCFWREARGALAGDNTDVEGLVAALIEAGLDVGGARVLLLGAGGGARAAALALVRSGAASVEISNRTPARARALAEALELDGVRPLEAPPRGPYELVVNATSLGLDPADPAPFELEGAPVRAVFDLVYGPGGTAWTRRARALGLAATDGLGMLVHQAALSLRRWYPRRDPPLEALRSAAEAELARRTPPPGGA